MKKTLLATLALLLAILLGGSMTLAELTDDDLVLVPDIILDDPEIGAVSDHEMELDLSQSIDDVEAITLDAELVGGMADASANPICANADITKAVGSTDTVTWNNNPGNYTLSSSNWSVSNSSVLQITNRYERSCTFKCLSIGKSTVSCNVVWVTYSPKYDSFTQTFSWSVEVIDTNHVGPTWIRKLGGVTGISIDYYKISDILGFEFDPVSDISWSIGNSEIVNYKGYEWGSLHCWDFECIGAGSTTLVATVRQNSSITHTITWNVQVSDADPTPTPTATPTPKVAPTTAPTTVPATTPTAAPTTAPTVVPTTAPTAAPTTTPTTVPTTVPTAAPTTSPTAAPTTAPTTAPTETPTEAPTQAPIISLSECNITVKNQVYTGKARKPAVTVKYGDTTLVRDVDYTVSYKNNKAIGIATAIVEGKGNYTGTVKKNFTILPKAVKLSALKAGKGTLTVGWKKGVNITGYQLQYALKKNFSGAKKKNVTKAATTRAILKGLKTGKTYYVRIRTYKKVGKKVYYSAWSAAKAAKVK